MRSRPVTVKTDVKLQLRLERIEKAAARARAGNLRSVGYLIATIAKGKIRQSKVKSAPGQPPTTRRGLLRRAIRYELSQDKRSVVIGPAFSIVGTAGQPHEQGGRYKGETFPERPFMGPSLQEAVPLIGPSYKIS
jgi:hypothetical protein